MIVSSPIGDMPFTPERLSVQRGAVTLHGSMGAWPSQVQLLPSDVVSLAKAMLPSSRLGWVVPILGLGLVGLAPRLVRGKHG